MTDESDSVTSRWWGRRLPRLGVGVLLLLMQSGCMCGCSARQSVTDFEVGGFHSADQCSQCSTRLRIEHAEAE